MPSVLQWLAFQTQTVIVFECHSIIPTHCKLTVYLDLPLYVVVSNLTIHYLSAIMKVLVLISSGFENPTGFLKTYLQLRGMSPKLGRSPNMGKANASWKMCCHMLEIL
jgi:hypothetical protein